MLGPLVVLAIGVEMSGAKNVQTAALSADPDVAVAVFQDRVDPNISETVGGVEFGPSLFSQAKHPIIGAEPEFVVRRLGDGADDFRFEVFGEADLGASYQWDAVFADGDVYKSGRTGQCLYVSPDTDTVVVFYSSAYKAEVWVHAYAREIVKTMFRDN